VLLGLLLLLLHLISLELTLNWINLHLITILEKSLLSLRKRPELYVCCIKLVLLKELGLGLSYILDIV
jgi:hypothetical protein